MVRMVATLSHHVTGTVAPPAGDAIFSLNRHTELLLQRSLASASRSAYRMWGQILDSVPPALPFADVTDLATFVWLLLHFCRVLLTCGKYSPCMLQVCKEQHLSHSDCTSFSLILDQVFFSYQLVCKETVPSDWGVKPLPTANQLAFSFCRLLQRQPPQTNEQENLFSSN